MWPGSCSLSTYSIRYRSDNIIMKKPDKPIDTGYVGCLIFIPLLFVAAALSFPYGVAMNFLNRRRERRLMAGMASGGRVIGWTDFTREIMQNHGTVIMEWESYKGPTRWWWTPDEVRVKSPCLLPDSNEVVYESEFQSFYTWCYETYTDPAAGEGMLVECTSEQKQSFKEQIRSGNAVITWTPRAPRR